MCSAASVLDRSDIILERPNKKASEAMPLGNGQLGLAVWAADGLTIQLNRVDTLPKRLSPGQIVIPGLAQLTSAKDYAGRLKLRDGEFVEHGGGMTATVYVQPGQDLAVVEVTGADPKVAQSVVIRLWDPRTPLGRLEDNLALFSETWTDSKVAGASGRTFGSLAAVSVEGETPRAVVDGTLAERIDFMPHSDGSFRVLIAAPHWAGGDAVKAVRSLLEPGQQVAPNAHREWWSKFWSHAGLFEMASVDGSAEYLENLRTLYLFMAAAGSGDSMPGSQAGTADLFSPLGDFHKWDPSAYWHFNLRMMVGANLGAGLFELNEPYFSLYRSNLGNVEIWTKSKMRGLPGACVPETMRFNGQGYENEDWVKTPGLNCDAGSPPYYNARTLSTGAEVSLWIWNQYLATDDREFLIANYPVIAASARFLLAYSKPGKDGKRHTFPTNAHENQWDVKDSTNDICAMRTLFPLLIQAAKTLGRDRELAARAQAALGQIQELPLSEGLDGEVVTQSYTPGAEIHNTENVGLEPVWPYGLIGDDGPLHELGVRTYKSRRNVLENDWSFDPLQAARLGLANEVKDGLLGLTKKYQSYPSGLASFVGDEFYLEQIGVVAVSLQEALVQDYDGLVRILPAWPKEWDVAGSVAIQHRSKVSVVLRGGVLGPVTIEAGFSGNMQVRNPWRGETAEVLSGGRLQQVQVSGDVLEFAVERGKLYSLEQSGKGKMLPAVSDSDVRFGSGPRFLGERSIGLGAGH